MVYAAPLAARPGFPQGSREKADGKPPGGSLLTSGGLTDAFAAYTYAIPFPYQQAHVAC